MKIAFVFPDRWPQFVGVRNDLSDNFVGGR